jgi:hypothetical protein
LPSSSAAIVDGFDFDNYDPSEIDKFQPSSSLPSNLQSASLSSLPLSAASTAGFSHSVRNVLIVRV